MENNYEYIIPAELAINGWLCLLFFSKEFGLLK
jgi:hypothetical protein